MAVLWEAILNLQILIISMKRKNMKCYKKKVSKKQIPSVIREDVEIWSGYWGCIVKNEIGTKEKIEKN